MSDTTRVRLGGFLIWMASIIALGTFRVTFNITEPAVIQTVGYILGLTTGFGITCVLTTKDDR